MYRTLRFGLDPLVITILIRTYNRMEIRKCQLFIKLNRDSLNLIETWVLRCI